MQQRRVNRGNKSGNYNLPAPIGGLNACDSLDLMAETDAIVMDNYIPGETKVALRKGFTRYVTTGTPIRTLVEFKAESGNNQFFAFDDNSVWDITSAASPQKVAGREYKNGQWQTTQFKNRLFAVNGEDAPQTYYLDDEGNGVWADAEFSGTNLIPEALVNVASSKQRLWFVEKGSMKVWYSENVSEIKGNLLSFDMTTVARDGGYLVAVASWTQDGGAGMDDLTVFLTSEGEALVYAGSNPNSADGWMLKGCYRIARPIGYRCVMQYQGDIVVITEDGYLPLSKALPLESANSSQIAFSNKIRGMVLERVANGRTKFGWQSIIYSRGGYAIFNVPYNQTFEQHVINLSTGAWCRFTGIKAYCWGLYQTRAYFGTIDGVMLFDEGYADDKLHIEGHIEQAFNRLGSYNLKKVQLLNPRTKSFNPYALTIYTNTDFSSQTQDYVENIGQAGQTKWNSVKWSSKAHPSGVRWAVLNGSIRSQWIANSATGFKFSIVFKTKTRGNAIEWYDTGMRYEGGTGII